MVDTRLGSLAVRVRGDGPVAVLWHSLFVDERPGTGSRRTSAVSDGW